MLSMTPTLRTPLLGAPVQGATPLLFTDPLLITPRAPVYGAFQPAIIHHPHSAQPAARELHRGLVGRPDIRAETPRLEDAAYQQEPETDSKPNEDAGERLKITLLTARALEALETGVDDTYEAGRLFRQARCEMQANPEFLTSELFAHVVFGEALYGQVDAETYHALRTVREQAEASGDQNIIAQELLVRSIAHARTGNDEAAFQTVKLLSQSEAAHLPGSLIRIQGMMLQANLLHNRARRYKAQERTDALNNLALLMNEDYAESIKMVRAAKNFNFETLDALGNQYIFMAQFLLAQNRPLDAIRVAKTAKELFPSNQSIQELFGDIDLTAPETAVLAELAQKDQDGDEIGFFTRLRAGAIEFCNAARFPNNKTFVKYALGGAMAGALVGSISSVVSNDPFPMQAAMTGAGIAAAGTVTAGMVRNAFRAEEPRQAFLTGHTTNTLRSALARFALPIAATYALFGGDIPLAGALPDAILASRNGLLGQIHGPGSLISYITSNGAIRGDELFNAISQQGLFDGAMSFWADYADTSYFAKPIDKALRLPFSEHPFQQIFEKYKFEDIPEPLRTFSFDTGLDSARSVALAAAYGYAATAVSYALLSIPRSSRQWFDKHLPNSFNQWIFPGAWVGTSLAYLASGMTPIDAMVFPIFCYMVHHRYTAHGGGDWKIWKTYKELDLPKYMVAGAAQLLYMGPGNAIKANVPKPDWDTASFDEMAMYIVHQCENHSGMVGFLVVLGTIHAVLTGLSVPQTLKAKYAKAWTTELPASVINLILGWTSLKGQVAKMIIKDFGLGGLITSAIRESGGSTLQWDVFRKILEKQVKSGEKVTLESLFATLAADSSLKQEMIDSAREFEREGMRAILSGKAGDFETRTYGGLTPAEQLTRMTTTYFLRDDTRLPLGRKPYKAHYNDIIYRALTQPETTQAEVDAYLERLQVIASDEDTNLSHVRGNYVLATIRAIRGQAHGTRIQAFFEGKDGQQILEAYGFTQIFDDMASKKKNEGPNAWSKFNKMPGNPRAWLDQHLITHKTPADIFYDGAATAGRRTYLSGTFTGRSVVENGAALSAFIQQAAQHDPAFQTMADRTLYLGTLFRFLMQEGKAEGFSDNEEYRQKFVQPMLDIIADNASRLHDSRRDIRHNLLVTVWLASKGPHGQMIRQWIEENRHLYDAHNISGNPELPTSLTFGRQIKRLFDEYLKDSDSSTDGKIVYPVDPPWQRISWPLEGALATP